MPKNLVFDAQKNIFHSTQFFMSVMMNVTLATIVAILVTITFTQGTLETEEIQTCDYPKVNGYVDDRIHLKFTDVNV